MIEVTYVLDNVENTLVIDREEFEQWVRPFVDEVTFIRVLKKQEQAAA